MKNIWREIFPSTSLRLLYPKTLRYGLEGRKRGNHRYSALSVNKSLVISRDSLLLQAVRDKSKTWSYFYIKSGKKCKLILYFVENIYIVYFQIKICLIYYGNTLSNKINTGLQCSKSVD